MFSKLLLDLLFGVTDHHYLFFVGVGEIGEIDAEAVDGFYFALEALGEDHAFPRVYVY